MRGTQAVNVSLALQGQRIPVALGAGYLDPPPPADTVAPPRRKMAVVVVTAGWAIICLDHNLNVLWEQSVHGHFPHHTTVREVRFPVCLFLAAFSQVPSCKCFGVVHVLLATSPLCCYICRTATAHTQRSKRS